MHCEVLKDNEGHPIGMVCGSRRSARHLCKFCQRDFVRKLCDFTVSAKGKTCDAGMCNRCSTSVGPDRDYCPDHKDQKPAAEQAKLFA